MDFLNIISGRAETCTERCMNTLEDCDISEGIQPRFLTAIATMFATYYVFKLQYPEKACGTLELIQGHFITFYCTL